MLTTDKERCAIFVANRGFALASSRLRIMQRLLASGWRVVAVATADEHMDKLTAAGIDVEPLVFARRGLAIRRDWLAYRKLVQVYRKYQPELIHHFNAKPVILGCRAARKISGVRVVNTITGLGHPFIVGGIGRKLAGAGYRPALRNSDLTIFQNSDDKELFINERLIPAAKARVIASSGVDTKRFVPAVDRQPTEAPRVLMVGRMLWQKGVREFVEAARICKKQFPKARFQLAGEWDAVHADAVPESWMQTQVEAGVVEHLGYLKNMPEVLPDVDVLVLPSYREGFPRVLLEAAACGLPVVTTDTAGCREAILPGETGLLVPAETHEPLAAAMAQLLGNQQQRLAMGAAGRRRVVAEFDAETIMNAYLTAYSDSGITLDRAEAQPARSILSIADSSFARKRSA